MTKKRVLFYCQPVLGMGHLVRSLAVLGGLSDFEVWLINGGTAFGTETRHLIPKGLNIIELPPLASDREFTDIRPIDPAADVTQVRAERQRILIDALGRVRPAVLMIELYPFGRLKFDFELRPLLQAARGLSKPPRIVCSLRDILVNKRDQAGFEQFAITTANRYFDLLLVHSDPGFQPLEETFPPVDQLTCAIEYTGYVIPAVAATQAAGQARARSAEPTIVASIGGGRVGVELLEAAIAASQSLHRSRAHRLRIFTGPYLPLKDWERLIANQGSSEWITISRFTPSLVDEMRVADLSISMAGYNTCLDLLTAGIRSIVHPFTGNNNNEQTIRARKLEAHGVVRLITAEELTPTRLAAMIRGMLDQSPNRAPLAVDLGGVRKSALLLQKLSS